MYGAASKVESEMLTLARWLQHCQKSSPPSKMRNTGGVPSVANLWNPAFSSKQYFMQCSYEAFAPFALGSIMKLTSEISITLNTVTPFPAQRPLIYIRSLPSIHEKSSVALTAVTDPGDHLRRPPSIWQPHRGKRRQRRPLPSCLEGCCAKVDSMPVGVPARTAMNLFCRQHLRCHERVVLSLLAWFVRRSFVDHPNPCQSSRS